jgi:hypothetical protein
VQAVLLKVLWAQQDEVVAPAVTCSRQQRACQRVLMQSYLSLLVDLSLHCQMHSHEAKQHAAGVKLDSSKFTYLGWIYDPTPHT